MSFQVIVAFHTGKKKYSLSKRHLLLNVCLMYQDPHKGFKYDFVKFSNK